MQAICQGWVFNFLIMSYETQKLCILMKSKLSIFPFVSCAFGVTPKKWLWNTGSQRFTPMLSHKSFIILALTFDSIWVNFHIFYEVGIPFHSFAHDYLIPESFVENTILSPFNFLNTPVKDHTSVLSHFSHAQLCATLRTVVHQILCPWDSPGKNTGVVCHALLQGIFWTQGLKLGLSIFCVGRWVLYH